MTTENSFGSKRAVTPLPSHALKRIAILIFVPFISFSFPKTERLEALRGLGLRTRTLGALLAGDTAGLALGGRGGHLGLIRLLGLRGGELLLLGLLDGRSARGGAGLGALATLLLDDVERGTNDGALGLHGAAGPLLGDFLLRESVFCFFLASSGRGLCARARERRAKSYLRDTLAVLAAVEGRPGYETGVLPLQEERLGLAALETEDLAVATDVDLTL